MDEKTISQPEKITKSFVGVSNLNKILLGTIAISLILGVISGYLIANKQSPKGLESALSAPPKDASQDTRTFKDFAEGTIKVKPQPSDPETYTEGTHLLQRDGAVPVALTSSVVDLSQYEGKKVKVFGETQKALKEGWLMDVGKIEVIK